MGLAALLHYYKPDTRCVSPSGASHTGSLDFCRVSSIQSWALAEAKERMEARGEKYKYEPSS